MFSEIDYLSRQLEYCILTKKAEAAKVIVNDLIQLRAKLKFEFKIIYECVCHDLYFGKLLKSANDKDFQYFNKCSHYICHDCLRIYIIETFNASKADFPFYCPGCLVQMKDSPTVLDSEQNYFKSSISEEEYRKCKEEAKKLDNTRIEQLKIGSNPRCYNLIKDEKKNLNKKHGKVCFIPSCFHVFCDTCLIDHFFSSVIQGKELTCPRDDCEQNLVDHNFVAELFKMDDVDGFFVLEKLKLEDFLYCKCPECSTNLKLDKSKKYQKCFSCPTNLCCFCGKARHVDISCFPEPHEYIYQPYREYECTQDSNSPELKQFYYHAASLFEWDILPARIQIVNSNRPDLMYCSYQIEKVYYVNNLKLTARYEGAKAAIEAKLGQPGEEIFVFHGSNEDTFASIFRDGFRIGGIDVGSKHGKRYGLGIYTAKDPVTSALYSDIKKRILVSRAVLGKLAPNIIEDENVLQNTEFDYFYVPDDQAMQKGSSYFIFYKTEYLLPVYLIQFH